MKHAISMRWLATVLIIFRARMNILFSMKVKINGHMRPPHYSEYSA